MIKRKLTAIIAIVIYIFAVVLIFYSELGLAGPYVLHLGICNQLGINFGQSIVIVSFIITGVLLGLTRDIDYISILYVVIGGGIFEILNSNLQMFRPIDLLSAVGIFGVALVMKVFAECLVEKSNLGYLPHMALIKYLSYKTLLTETGSRLVIDILLVSIGFLLGGTVGVGTLVMLLTISPLKMRIYDFIDSH